jgi:hypothetical protein
VIASVDTYLRFAEAVGRLNLQEADNSQGLPDLLEGMTESGAKSKTKGALEGVKEKVGIGGGDDDDSGSRSRSKSSSSRSRSSSRRRSSGGDDDE